MRQFAGHVHKGDTSSLVQMEVTDGGIYSLSMYERVAKVNSGASSMLHSSNRGLYLLNLQAFRQFKFQSIFYQILDTSMLTDLLPFAFAVAAICC